MRDQCGQPVGATGVFRQFRQHVSGEYQLALLDAMRAARRVGVPERDMVTASVFTTQSTTALLEKIRDQIKATRSLWWTSANCCKTCTSGPATTCAQTTQAHLATSSGG